ncbi:hypothetical protein PV10_07734 [Exophiala mesophila]|uniref:Ubiquitin 3 binding protein But2 C-terminal domain-containing protein n=1 Tax=Exophiala mesophila TaxID=212818 RepID=A0A0D1WN22_EXOME|nr:uncharacterized protein PV10_07734 [Exophiala mesophila]KIV90425.1 hypothetical protein PV10_07734 [Exophiala mesophila]
MKSVAAVAILAGLAAAYPGELIRKRALEPREGCPRDLTPGQFEFPHYITQISKSEPDKKFGPQLNGVFTPNDIASIFSFDVPVERSDANCTLEFIFPAKAQLQTSNFEYEGGGSFFFSGYNPGSCPNANTTWNNQPAPGPFPDFPPIHMEPGNAYTIDVGPCFVGAGSCVAGKTWSNDTNFWYFQDSGECPIGIYTAYTYGEPARAAPS